MKFGKKCLDSILFVEAKWQARVEPIFEIIKFNALNYKHLKTSQSFRAQIYAKPKADFCEQKLSRKVFKCASL